ncbi:rhomboid protease ROM3, putative [Plasmodium chabaudi chabaudi]|uniref:Rhomboid-like protease n=2 Tax=Plasmodium chabaudi TaxID=5825 RepID=A0A077XF62_PLACU|nr:rhomboid protease ROM3, putative [Plasmodium chabaudi chabaudi]SCM21446.1 rhomboid protease ROM3, putative [Plasmodium chabaudi adami]SCN60725.1 rhomboid protease ROM3, putative [Plasmodium chabaudi chabaudi]SCN60726.1 rhomboid protease ROM3, putative [Plasmodium chabaudi adami]VTZ68963.1 rhomboid protease ROM3, putative [Plasmodium chabaudi chabaudi]|eukprot:XP_016655447.1 rhomboid protease ROM3, putative [Plasmodium chabaudi chabaudi]
MLNEYAENNENSNLLPGTAGLIEKNAQNKFYDALFPHISLNRIIVWISFFQILIYILSCLLSENLTVPNVDVLMFLGATYGPSIKQGELWRLVFPIFLHANWWHLIINIICILNLGLVIETKYKKKRFLLIYFLSGFIGNTLTTICNPCQLAVGASTSGFGLIGCSIMEIFLAWKNLSKKAKNYYIFNISIFLVFFLFVSFSPTVDFFGHIGGFVCGAFLACHYNKFLGYDIFQECLHYGFASICALIIFYLPLRLFVLNMPCEFV